MPVIGDLLLNVHAPRVFDTMLRVKMHVFASVGYR